MLPSFPCASWLGRLVPKSSAGQKEGSVFSTLVMAPCCQIRGLQVALSRSGPCAARARLDFFDELTNQCDIRESRRRSSVFVSLFQRSSRDRDIKNETMAESHAPLQTDKVWSLVPVFRLVSQSDGHVSIPSTALDWIKPKLDIIFRRM